MCDCNLPNGIEFKINGIPIEPCNFVEVGCYRNVSIQILKCQKCGKISIGWKKQENTEFIEEGYF